MSGDTGRDDGAMPVADAPATLRLDPRSIGVAWLVIAATLLAFAASDSTRLGLYYDEAFLAQQARDFVDVGRESNHPASVRDVEVFGRSFPTYNAAYLGSLKSQLTIPAFAAFGASPRVLRVTTTVIALIALGLCMYWLGRLFGPAVAIVTGGLVASDPAFFFLSQFEWGPFTTNLLCRAIGAVALLAAWRSTGRRAAIWAAGAGAALGLGIYSRADFAVILAVAGLALLAVRRDLVFEALRTRRATVASGTAALLATSAPMWTNLSALFSTGEAISGRGDLGDRFQLLVSTLDGTRFHALMKVGGLFDQALDVVVEPTPLIGCAAGSFVLLAIETLRRRRDASARDDDTPEAGARARDEFALRAWLLLTTLGITLGMLALPGAVRAHHQLNVLPLWHAVIAVAAVDLFGRAWRDPRRALLARGLVSVVIGFVVAGGVSSIAQTRELVHDTGGRGRWTLAIHELAADLERDGGEAVSLDWGFHEPLLFLTRDVALREAIWDIPAALRAGRAWGHRGGPGTVYLFHDGDYDLFGLGPRMLEFTRSEGLEVETHRDGEGVAAFYTLRIPRSHVLVFDGRFRLQ